MCTSFVSFQHFSVPLASNWWHERTKIWWTHTKVCTWTHKNMVNARKSDERTEVWTWTHESLVNARKSDERTKVWTWTHKSLDIGTFRLGRSGHKHFPSGTVWTYRLSVWDLNLGSSSSCSISIFFNCCFCLLLTVPLLLIVYSNPKSSRV